MRCYHVTTNRGNTYGVAATSVRDAMTFLQDRLNDEGSKDLPVKATNTGSCSWAYGTVMAY